MLLLYYLHRPLAAACTLYVPTPTRSVPKKLTPNHIDIWCKPPPALRYWGAFAPNIDCGATFPGLLPRPAPALYSASTCSLDKVLLWFWVSKRCQTAKKAAEKRQRGLQIYCSPLLFFCRRKSYRKGVCTVKGKPTGVAAP